MKKFYGTIEDGTLDAQTLDNLNSTQFLRSDVGDTMTGSLTTTGSLFSEGVGTSVQTQLNSKSELGVGQTWQNVARSLGVTYTNSTGKPIEIMATLSYGGTYTEIDGLINGVIHWEFNYLVGSGAWYTTWSAIIPNGGTYRINNTGTVSVARWSELR